jgi:hypothetical protein
MTSGIYFCRYGIFCFSFYFDETSHLIFLVNYEFEIKRTEAKHCSLIIFSIKHNRSDISWRSVLFVEVTGISGENSRQKSLTNLLPNVE